MRLPALLVAGALLLSIGGYVAVPHAVERPTESPWPAALELDTLSRYVSPVAVPPPAEGEIGVELPRYGALLGETAAIQVRTTPAMQRERSVSAILIMGDRRVAVIDDVTVRPGDRLVDGASVIAIEANRVTLGETDGRRTILGL